MPGAFGPVNYYAETVRSYKCRIMGMFCDIIFRGMTVIHKAAPVK